MLTLYFDTETTGLPVYGERSAHPRQPFCVQLACQLVCKETSRTVNSIAVIIDNDVDVPSGAAKVHGITREMAKKYGVSPQYAFASFMELADKADTIVGHNVQFDLRIMKIYAERVGLREPLEAVLDGKLVECTMFMAKPIVKAPLTEKQQRAGMRGFKSPRLEEAYRHFFGKELENAHDAQADVDGCREVHLRMLALAENSEESAA